MLRNVSANFLAQIWSLVLSLGDRIILVGILLRFWGTDVYADWATLFAIVGLISMGEMGLNIYFGNNMQRAHAMQDRVAFQRIIGISLFSYFVLGILLAVLATSITLWLDFSFLYSIENMNPHHVFYIFLLLAVTQIIRVSISSVSQIYRGFGQFAIGTWVNSIRTLAIIIFVGMSVVLGGEPLLAAIIYLGTNIIMGWAVVLFDLKRRFPHIKLRGERPNLSEIGILLSHTKWYGLMQGAPIAWLNVPILIAGSLGYSGGALVSFLLARTLVNFSRQIPDILARSVGIEMAEAFHLQDREKLEDTFVYFGKFLSGLSSAIIGGLIWFGAPTIQFWSGQTELFDAWIFFWLLLPAILIAPALPLKNILMLSNLPKLLGQASLLQVLLGLSLSYLFAYYYGLPGLVAGLGFGEVLAIAIFLPYISYHHLGKNYIKYFTHCILISTATAAWSSLVAWILLELVVGANGIITYLVRGFGWCIFGLLPVIILCTPKLKRVHIIKKVNQWIKDSF